MLCSGQHGDAKPGRNSACSELSHSAVKGKRCPDRIHGQRNRLPESCLPQPGRFHPDRSDLDQTVQSGTPPEGFSYGSEFTRDQINEALRSETPLEIVPSADETGHGTYAAGLAAGGADAGEGFLGAAPESTIAVVKLKQAKKYLRDYYFIPEDAVCYQETDLILALKYLNDLADSLNLLWSYASHAVPVWADTSARSPSPFSSKVIQAVQTISL